MLQQLLQTKRARTHTETANDHEECDKKSSDDWDLADYRREATRIQNHHSTPLGSRAEVPTPQEGKTVPLEYSRLGLVTCFQELVKRLQDRHVKCVEAVATKSAADAASADAVTPDAQNVLHAMMQLE